jgi:endonuclease/exonuclease/phosphatase family metal-dependent hydrolase
VEDQFALFAELLPGFDAIAGVALETRDEAGKPKRFGNMLLTRLPVVQVMRHTLPWPARETNNMTRGLIEAVLMTISGPLRIMTTHLEYSHPDIRAAQIEAIRDIHAAACARVATPRNDGPGTYRLTHGAASAVLTGDVNMKPGDPLLARLGESFPEGHPPLRDAWPIANGAAPHPLTACIVDQSFAAPHCCDYIFVTDDLAPRIRRIVCDEDTRVSDHQPILIELA